MSMFTLADNRVVTDEETNAEIAGSIGGPIIAPVDIASARVARTLEPGAVFQFTVDDVLQQAGPVYRWLWQVQDSRPRRWPCRSSIA